MIESHEEQKASHISHVANRHLKLIVCFEKLSNLKRVNTFWSLVIGPFFYIVIKIFLSHRDRISINNIFEKINSAGCYNWKYGETQL